MSLSLYIFCKSNQQITRSDVLDSIRRESVFQSATISPAEHDAASWDHITLTYHPQKQPVVFTYYAPGKALTRIIKDVIDDFGTPMTSEAQRVFEVLAQTRQAIVIELATSGVPEDVWEAIDCVEAHIAFSYEGWIYVPDEGFYDEGLDQIFPV